MMNIIEFNLIMSLFSMCFLAGSLFVFSTIHSSLHWIAITIRVFVAFMLAALHIDLLIRFII